MIEEKTLDLPLSKHGTSLGIIIPKKVLEALNLKYKDFIKVTLTRKELEAE